MRSVSRALLISAALITSNLVAVSRAEAGWFPNSWGDVVVSTDMTPEGRALARPTSEQPVRYRGMSLGCTRDSIPGDRMPDVQAINRVVTRVLAKQGYLGARPGEEPELFVFLQWGYYRPGSDNLLWFLGYDANKDIAAPVFPGMLGAEVFRRGFRPRAVETVLDYADEPLYGIIVTAFEFKTVTSAHPVIYWQTRIALPAQGKSMAQALPAMAFAAGPAIGRESDLPALYDADDGIKGQVELGEAEVLGFEEAPPPEKPAAAKRK